MQNEHPYSTSHSYQVDPPQLARRLLISAWTISESLPTTALASKDFWFLIPMVEALVLGLAKGKPFSRERGSPTGQISSIFRTLIAAILAQLDRGSRLIFPAASPDIFVMEILPGWTDKSMEREMKSPRPSTAQLRKSKPWPRLATVAGTKVLTEANMGSGSSSGMWVGLEFGIDRL